MNEALRKYWNKEKAKKFTRNSSNCEHQYYTTIRNNPDSRITHQQVMCRETGESCLMRKCPILDSILNSKK